MTLQPFNVRSSGRLADLPLKLAGLLPMSKPKKKPSKKTAKGQPRSPKDAISSVLKLVPNHPAHAQLADPENDGRVWVAELVIPPGCFMARSIPEPVDMKALNAEIEVSAHALRTGSPAKSRYMLFVPWSGATRPANRRISHRIHPKTETSVFLSRTLRFGRDVPRTVSNIALPWKRSPPTRCTSRRAHPRKLYHTARLIPSLKTRLVEWTSSCGKERKKMKAR
jgi:hypothetical protein